MGQKGWIAKERKGEALVKGRKAEDDKVVS